MFLLNKKYSIQVASFFSYDSENNKLTNLSFEKVELPFSNCCSSFAEGVNFSNSIFEKSIFADAFLQNARFHNSTFTNVDFSRSDLRNANFKNADLRNADFEDCDLVIEAVFEDPNLKDKVTKETEAVLAADKVYASNTSTIPITSVIPNVPSLLISNIVKRFDICFIEVFAFKVLKSDCAFVILDVFNSLKLLQL